MVDVSLKSAIETSIRAEELGFQFYKEMADKFADSPELKTIFELLENDEFNHIRQFNELLLSAPEKYISSDSTEFEFMKIVDISVYFNHLEISDPSTQPADIISMAFNFEKDSVLFYQEIKNILGPSEILDEIIRTEKCHVSKIMTYTLSDSKFRGLSDKWD